MMPGGHTQCFAVLGHPIHHTLSPAMHNASFEALGLDAVYLAFDVHPDRLMEVLPVMAAMGFKGVNLTVPLKEVAAQGLPELEDSARLVGAVNTVEFMPDGSLRGHNTDGYGFLHALKEGFDIHPKGRTVFMLGAGGAGRALALTCAAHGAAEILLTDMDTEKVRKVEAEIRQAFPDTRTRIIPAHAKEQIHAAREASLVLHSTPVGMRQEDPALLGPEAFCKDQYLFDLIYMYPQTSLMKAARQAGARTQNGLAMLLYQGAQSFRIWTGTEPDVASMRQALETRVYGTAG